MIDLPFDTPAPKPLDFLGLDLSFCRLTPYQHQIIGIKHIIEHPFCGLFDEMGAGKTKQTIDAAQLLFKMGLIDQVLIVAPASVRGVWFDRELGELEKHLNRDIRSTITEFHAKSRTWTFGASTGPELKWMVTNYEFIRASNRLKELLPFCTERTLLVLDESSAVKNIKADQTVACLELRQRCGRVLLLNGTPIANNPGDLYAQCELMDPSVLSCRSYFVFRSRYAIMGGFQNKQIIDWTNLDDLQQRIAPYVLRRLKTDCLDLPPKLPPVIIQATLSVATWKMYVEMRDEMVAWLSNSTVSVAGQAIVKAMRLAQLTSGFLGGVEASEDPGDGELFEARPAWLPSVEPVAQPEFVAPTQSSLAVEVGREKLDAILEWHAAQMALKPDLKILIWCRFRPQAERLAEELKKAYPTMPVGMIIGGQSEDKYKVERDKSVRTHTLIKEGDRGKALRLLDPRTAPEGPVAVVGTEATGNMGLNLTAADTVLYASNDYSLKIRLQSEDRVHRPGQTKPVHYFDMVAVGPKGQKTVDHVVIKALRGKLDLATLTTSAWISTLRDE